MNKPHRSRCSTSPDRSATPTLTPATSNSPPIPVTGKHGPSHGESAPAAAAPARSRDGEGLDSPPPLPGPAPVKRHFSCEIFGILEQFRNSKKNWNGILFQNSKNPISNLEFRSNFCSSFFLIGGRRRITVGGHEQDTARKWHALGRRGMKAGRYRNGCNVLSHLHLRLPHLIRLSRKMCLR